MGHTGMNRGPLDVLRMLYHRALPRLHKRNVWRDGVCILASLNTKTPRRILAKLGMNVMLLEALSTEYDILRWSISCARSEMAALL
jgi:hypothetical protein